MSFASRVKTATDAGALDISSPEIVELASLAPVAATPAAVAYGSALVTAAAAGAQVGDAVD